MTIARIGLLLLLGFCVTTGSVQFSWGQILSTAEESTSVGVEQAGGLGDETGEVKQTSWPSIPLPKITMPQITMPQMAMPKLWPSTEDDRPALLTPFVAGASKVSEGTRKAWEGMRDMFSVGAGADTSAVPTAAEPSRPSIWKRLITRAPAEDEGPQTVGEFMSQKRMNP